MKVSRFWPQPGSDSTGYELYKIYHRTEMLTLFNDIRAHLDVACQHSEHTAPSANETHCR